MELWFSRYPADEAIDLRERFRSRRPGQHEGAWWELYLFELLAQLGYQVTPHPDLPGTKRKPDYEIARGSFRAYVEAAVVTSGIVTEDLETPDWMLDAINLIEAPSFFIHIDEMLAHGTERLKNAQVVSPIQGWLDSLDPDEVSADFHMNGQLPAFTLDKRGWRVRLQASTVRSDARGSADHRVFGSGPVAGGMVDDIEQLLDKLNEKSGRYGRPDIPMVTAVHCDSAFMEDQDVAQALFGREAIQIGSNDSTTGTARLIRQRNGFWMRENGPRSKRVSAVLTAVGLKPWNCTSVVPRLWLNPWADHPFSEALPFPSATCTDRGTVTNTERELDMGSVLGLSNPWPPGEPFPR